MKDDPFQRYLIGDDWADDHPDPVWSDDDARALRRHLAKVAAAILVVGAVAVGGAYFMWPIPPHVSYDEEKP
jgi:hypothetical protein